MRSLAGAFALMIALLAAPAAEAKTYEDKERGFSIQLLRDWSQTPTQPGEKIEVAKFKDDRKGEFATLSIYRFVTGGGGVATPESDDVDDGVPPAPDIPQYPGFSQPKTAKEYLERLLTQGTERLQQYAKARDLDAQIPGVPEPKVVKFGKIEGEIYVHEVEAINQLHYPGSFRVMGIVARDGVEYLIEYGCALNRARKLTRSFVMSIRSFRFLDAGDTEEEGDDDPAGTIIGGKPEDLIDIPKRNRIKAELVGTWKFIDTPRYIVIYNCDWRLASYIARRIEYMREYAFETVFPPIAPIEECMVVRVCKEMDEYYHYGAPRGSAGYWASFHDELVFPDLAQSSKPDEKTIGVLHHEGFHQYIYYCLLKHNPPVWFNEGCAEYFFCVNYKTWGKGNLNFIKRHPMRYSTIKTMAGSDTMIPVKDFIRLSHGQYMARAQMCYSQGWAFITFCKNVTRNKRYQDIPTIYFNELQQGYAEAGKGGDVPGGLPPGFMGRDNEVTQRALEKAFEGIDLEELHKDFVQGVKRGM